MESPDVSQRARHFFEFLDSKGLTPPDTERTVQEMSVQEAVELLEEMRPLLPRIESKDSNLRYEFAVSQSLGGGPEPCSSASCRIPHADDLSRFASLYADRVHIPCPFDRYAVDKPDNGLPYYLGEDFHVVSRLRPLMEAGLVGFRKSEFEFCQIHYEDAIQGIEHIQEKYNDAARRTFDNYRENVSVELVGTSDLSRLVVEGPNELVPHGALVSPLHDLPDWLEERHKPGEVVVLEGDDPARNAVLAGHVNRFFSNLLFLDWYSQYRGIDCLTDNTREFDVLEAANPPAVNERNRALIDAFTHEIPTIVTDNVSEILEVRESAPEAFRVYRDALSESLKEALSEEPGMAAEIFDDIVRPEVNRIEKAVRGSRRKLKRSLGQDIAVGAGFITVGLFSGILPANFGEVLAIAGGLPKLSNVLDKASRLLEDPELAREQRYYFLWKVHQTDR